ncbi:MAG: DUF2510 domain-containing protein [Microcella pacifica]
MAEDDYGRVPAGWYPDPLGLPQLRWWDNTAWTEHVSDARQPMVPTEAPTAPAAPTMFADDDLPRRRDLRTASTPEDAPLDDPAREGSEPEQPALQPPTANVLPQVAPPTTGALSQLI